MRYWKKLSKSEIKERIFNALSKNTDFRKKISIGIPGSYLDNKVFQSDSPILEDAPYLSTLVHNPNHIGCHTKGESEPFFSGTQDIERELIGLLSEDILMADEHSCDGYVASGGTEANIQAIWIYRNMFMKENNAKIDEICIICSEDSHYSMPKAANVLNIDIYYTSVNSNKREILKESVIDNINTALNNGKKYFIVVANMATTMFGSVDNPDIYTNQLEKKGISYKLHIDGAYGGFIYPINKPQNNLNFSNPKVSSITIDAHKMLQAPYGTGIFLIRKNYIHNVLTEKAEYVSGLDLTLIGSRSGANAIAVWMIMMTYGPYGWFEKMHTLIYRTNFLCDNLEKRNIQYFRQEFMNIVTIPAKYIDRRIAHQYGLVPDNHVSPNWWKIVVMDHVEVDILEKFIQDLSK